MEEGGWIEGEEKRKEKERQWEEVKRNWDERMGKRMSTTGRGSDRMEVW